MYTPANSTNYKKVQYVPPKYTNRQDEKQKLRRLEKQQNWQSRSETKPNSTPSQSLFAEKPTGDNYKLFELNDSNDSTYPPIKQRLIHNFTASRRYSNTSKQPKLLYILILLNLLIDHLASKEIWGTPTDICSGDLATQFLGFTNISPIYSLNDQNNEVAYSCSLAASTYDDAYKKRCEKDQKLFENFKDVLEPIINKSYKAEYANRHSQIVQLTADQINSVIDTQKYFHTSQDNTLATPEEYNIWSNIEIQLFFANMLMVYQNKGGVCLQTSIFNAFLLSKVQRDQAIFFFGDYSPQLQSKSPEAQFSGHAYVVMIPKKQLPENFSTKSFAQKLDWFEANKNMPNIKLCDPHGDYKYIINDNLDQAWRDLLLDSRIFSSSSSFQVAKIEQILDPQELNKLSAYITANQKKFSSADTLHQLIQLAHKNYAEIIR